MQLCLATIPINKLSDRVIFPMDELWALTRMDGIKIINAVNSLDQVFNSLNDAMELYSTRIATLIVDLPHPTNYANFAGEISLTLEDIEKFSPRVGGLNFMLDQILPMSEKVVQGSFNALSLIVRSKRRPLGRNFSISLPDPSGAKITLKAPPTTGSVYKKKMINIFIFIQKNLVFKNINQRPDR